MIERTRVAVPSSANPPDVRQALLIAWGLAFVKLVLHTAFNDQYGLFRDELGYLACGERFGFGYVHQPPLIPWLAELSRLLLGDSLRAIRFIPALASSLLVVQGAVLAREFGAGRLAIVLTAICVALAPQYLSNAALLGTNALEPTLWMGCAYFALRAVKYDDPRQWLWFGIVAGIGLEEKYTIALFGFGIVLGLLLTAQRRAFAERWFWLGGLAALAIFLPNLLWNWANGWPFLELQRAIRADGRDVVLPALDYFLQQTLLVDPLAAPVWLVGLGALLFARRFAAYRFLGIAYLVCYGVLFALHGKSYYLAPIYPLLFAAGAATLERWFAGTPEAPRRFGWATGAIALLVLANGLYLAPIVVPVFSPERFVAYAATLPFKLPVMEHSHERAKLPQWYADQFGWKEVFDATAAAWQRVPPAERADCGIFAQNYGQAGAIDFWGPAQGLPRPLSGDRTYFLWGPGNYSGNCMIVLDDRQDVLERYWEHVELAVTSAPNRWAMEAELPVYICRGRKFDSWQAFWQGLRHWH